MRITRCSNGHFYDADQSDQCPYCNDISTKVTIPTAFLELGDLSPLGSGSISEVFKISGSQEYALKIVRCEHDAAKYQNALYELHIMQQLKGEALTVQLQDFEISKDEKTVFFLEDYHTSLSSYLANHSLTAVDAVRIVIGICDALNACKNRGVLHLDIHPRNIFVDNPDQVLLGDFGSSLFLKDVAANRAMRGTMAYMAPEVYRDGKCSEQSDIYSAGLILFALFNHRILPFMDTDSEQIAIYKRLAGTKLPAVSLENAELGIEINRIIGKACAYDHKCRYENLTAFKNDLCRLYEIADSIPDKNAVVYAREEESHKRKGHVFDADSVATSTTVFGSNSLPGVTLFDADSQAASVSLFDSDTVDQTASPAAPGLPIDTSGQKWRTDGGDDVWGDDVWGGDFWGDDVWGDDVWGGDVQGSNVRGGGSWGDDVWGDDVWGGDVQGSNVRGGGGSWDPGSAAKPNSLFPLTQHGIPGGSTEVRYKIDAPGLMKRCRVCDNPIGNDAFFCSYCGCKVEIEKPSVDIRQVEFSAIAPKTLIKGDYTMINIIMYEEAYRHVVDAAIQEVDTPVQEKRSGIIKVQDEAQIRVVLTSPDIEIEDNEETGIWQGGHLDFSFAVFLPDDYSKRQIFLTAAVYVNDLIATKLKFIVKCASLLEQKIEMTREDVLSAFVSYASQDRNRVAAIIQGMKKAWPEMDIFFDVESLRSGDDWERALYREIDKRDLLFLCWSHFARDSKWVDAEWRYALEQKGAEYIEPIPIESPDDCPPPTELNHKHFNDKLLFIINSSNEIR